MTQQVMQQKITVRGLAGSGKKCLIGALIYKCGLDLATLERMEKSNVNNYDAIPAFFEENKLDMGFYGPSQKYIFESMLGQKEPNVALWVVDVTDAARLSQSSNELMSLLSTGSLQPKERLIILINKLDKVDWVEQSFRQAAAAFEQIKLVSPKTVILPIAASTGENFFEHPDQASWLNKAPSLPPFLQVLE